MKFNSNLVTHPITSSIATILVLSSLSLTAFADNKVPDIKVVEYALKPAVDSFKKVDANQDGQISPQEATGDKTLSSNYDAADANHDGAISLDEYIAFNVVLPEASSKTN